MDLSQEAQKWLDAMHASYNFEPHSEQILQQAACLLDRIAEARIELQQAASHYFTDRHGVVRVHPAVKVEKDATALFATLIGKLKLPEDAPTLPASRVHQPRRGM